MTKPKPLMQFVEKPPRITDVLLVASPYAHGGGNPGRPVVYFERSYRILDDVWLANFDVDFARRILDACEHRGENFHAHRQYGAPYGFVRVSAPEVPGHAFNFDHDARLLTCVALSRLVHPTSIGFENAARIRTSGDGHRQVIPHTAYELGAYAFVTDTDQNWLVPADVPAISKLAAAYLESTLPPRVSSALWHSEIAARTHYTNVRWPTQVTALESLIHVAGERDPRNPKRYAGSTRVFVDRLVAIGRNNPSLSVSEGTLGDIYDKRSTLAHGQSFGGLDPATKQLVRTTEQLLRNILKACILDRSFASTFASDGAVQSNYPLT
jgi:hypothetical protein